MVDIKVDISMPYGLDYCCQSTAMYINGKLISEDVRVGDVKVMEALGYKESEIPSERVDQQWIEDREWRWPESLISVKFAEE